MKLNHLIIIGALCGALLLPSSASSWGVVGLAGGGGCGSFSSGDLLHETFDGAGYDNSWTENIAGTGSVVDEDESTVPSGQCGFDTDWLQIVVPSGIYGRAQAYTDLSESQTAIYVRFALYIGSEGLEDGQTRFLVTVRNTSSVGDSGNAVVLTQAEGQLQLALYSGYASRDTYNISTETTYCVEAYWHNTGTGDGWQWWIDGVDTGSGANDPETDFQRIKVGGYGDAAQNIPVTFYIDSLDVSTTRLQCDN